MKVLKVFLPAIALAMLFVSLPQGSLTSRTHATEGVHGYVKNPTHFTFKCGSDLKSVLECSLKQQGKC